MRVFENGVLSKILGPKREELRVDWIEFYVEEFMICTALVFA